MTSARSSTIVRRWVALYTQGLPPNLRDRRRAEIESDLWAHADEAAALGRAPMALDAEMLLRLVLGVPADIAWRRSHTVRSHADSKEIEMQSTRTGLSRLGIVIAAAWVAFLLFMTVVALIATATNGHLYWLLPAAAVGMAGAVVALLGTLTVDRNAVVGLALTIVGAALVGFGWTMATDNGLYGLVVALAVGGVGGIRGLQLLGSRRPQPA